MAGNKDKIFGMTEKEIIEVVKERGEVMDSNERKTQKVLGEVVRSGVEKLKNDSKYCNSMKANQ